MQYKFISYSLFGSEVYSVLLLSKQNEQSINLVSI